MSTAVQILVALVVPIGWGLLSSWAFDRLKLRRECKLQDTQSQEATAE